jgi:uncharacterized protein
MQPLEQVRYGAPRPEAHAQAATDFMWGVYRWMALGLLVTGLVAMWVAGSEQALSVVFGNRAVFWGLLIAQLGVVFAFNAVATRAGAAVTAAMFMGYAALTGVTFSSIFVAYTSQSIAQVFFVTSGAFAGLSVFGTVTKRDLSGVGRFMFMGLIGLVIASVVNIWLASPAVYWVSTYAGVLIFAGLTAYETQKLRQIYSTSGGAGNLALRGALILYLDFINLFLMLLRLFGSRRD